MDQKRVADQRNLDAPMAIRSGIWAWSPDHGQICQFIEAQTLWGETTCRVWLPGRDSVVRIPASRLKSLESAGTGSTESVVARLQDQAREARIQEHRARIAREREKANYAFAARRKTVERIGLPQVRDYRLNLLAQEERSFQEQLDQKAHAYPEMVPLLVIRVESSTC